MGNSPAKPKTTKTQHVKPSNPDKFRVVVFGIGGSGKPEYLSHFSPTGAIENPIEELYTQEFPVDSVVCNLEVLVVDESGEYAAMRDQWIRDGQGFVLLFSVTNLTTFSELSSVVDQIMRAKDTDSSQIPLVFVGNTSLLTSEDDRQVQKEEAEKFVRQHSATYFESNVTDAIMAKESMAELVRVLRDRAEAVNRRPMPK
jgi:GTPase KRas protein